MATWREEILQARGKDQLGKEKIKKDTNSDRNVGPHNIRQGNAMLLRRKTTKHALPDSKSGCNTNHRSQEKRERHFKRYTKMEKVKSKRYQGGTKH